MTKEQKLVTSLLKSVQLRRPLLSLPLVISGVALIFLFGITTLAYFCSSRTDSNLRTSIYFIIAISILVYLIIIMIAKFSENSYFSRACQQWCLGNLDFIATFVIERPHTKKFYRNPASLIMIAKVLYEIGDKQNSLAIKQNAERQNGLIKKFSLDSRQILTTDENVLLDIWKKRL